MDLKSKSVSAWRINILVFLSYIALTVLMTMPLITRLGSHIPAAEGSDVWIHEWTFWWVERALLNLQNPFYTDLLFHPTGVSLTTHNIAWFNIGVWFPLQAAFGNTIAYSLTYIIVFTLNAFCMYLLTYGWTRSRAAGFVAGLIYGFWPYTFTQSGHPNMATIMWPPLVLFYLKRLADKKWGDGGQRRNIIMAGIFIALTGIARWQLLIVVSLLLGVYLLYIILQKDRADRSSKAQLRDNRKSSDGESAKSTKSRLATQLSVASRLVLPFVLAGLLMLPLGGPVIYTQLTQDFPEEVLVYEPWFGTPLLTYLLPNSRLGLYNSLVAQLPESLQFHYQRVDFLGYTVLILAAIGLIWRWRYTAIWLLIALLYWLLALGPELTLAYERLPDWPMPYRLVEDFPLTRIVRRPHRFNAFVGLPLGLMAGYGVTVLTRSGLAIGRKNHSGNGPSLARRSGSAALVIIISLFIMAEYRPSPFGLESTYIPRWYYQLAADPDDFAILGLPPSPRLADKYFMHYQILHEKPMVEGHISRPTYETFGFMDQSDYLWHLRVHRTMKSELVDVTNQLQLLVDANVRYLILHKYLLTDEQQAQFIDWLTYDPIYEDEELSVYNADPQLGRDFDIEEWLTNEIGLIRIGNGPEAITQGEVFALDVRWASRDIPVQDYEACLSFRAPDDPKGMAADQSCFVIGGERSTSLWDANEIVRGDYTMRVDPLLEPNDYLLSLDLVPKTEAADAQREVIAQRELGLVTVNGRERDFTPPDVSTTTTLQWDEQITLHGFTTEYADEKLTVKLVWQAEKRLENSFKFFVHVLDQSTGELIAQHDAVPRDWAYPTTWWEANEFVDDTIELSLSKPPTGHLQVLVGLYDENSGVRLPVMDAEGTRFPDDAARLTTIEAE